MPNLPDESHLMDRDDWTYSGEPIIYRDYRGYWGLPIWAVITLPLAGLAFIITVVCACCRAQRRRPAADIRYQSMCDTILYYRMKIHYTQNLLSQPT